MEGLAYQNKMVISGDITKCLAALMRLMMVVAFIYVFSLVGFKGFKEGRGEKTRRDVKCSVKK